MTGRNIKGIQPPPRPPEFGNSRAVTHGAKAELIIAPRAAELREHLRSIVPAASPADEPAIALLAMALARVERANEYLADCGLLDGDGMPRPVLKVLSTWENSAARLCDHLGLTPTSRARLGLDLARGEAVVTDRLRSVEGAADRAEARLAGGTT